MNDVTRLSIGILGTATSWGLDQFAKTAAIVASIATAAFMTVSIVEKIQNLRRK